MTGTQDQNKLFKLIVFSCRYKNHIIASKKNICTMSIFKTNKAKPVIFTSAVNLVLICTS